MFKIGDEVMDKDGHSYTIIGIKDGFCEVLGYGTVEETYFAKYDPLIGAALVKIAESITKIGSSINKIENIQTDLFEKARRKT